MSSVLKGAAVGLVAGLAASFVMEQVQAMLQPEEQGGGDSATEKAADRVSQAANGRPVAKHDKAEAGRLVHYGFGAAIGLVYGALAANWRGITAGFGGLFGLGVALAADEALVPALGLGPPPTDTSPQTHAYSLTSHLIFGLSLEAVRRALAEAL